MRTQVINNDQMRRGRVWRVFGLLLVMVAVVALFTLPAFADGTTAIEDGVKTGLGQIYDIIKGVSVPIAVVCFAICAFKIFMGGEKGMEQAKKLAIYTVIGMAIVFLAPAVILEVKGWFEGGSADVSSEVFGTTGT